MRVSGRRRRQVYCTLSPPEGDEAAVALFTLRMLVIGTVLVDSGTLRTRGAASSEVSRTGSKPFLALWRELDSSPADGYTGGLS